MPRFNALRISTYATAINPPSRVAISTISGFFGLTGLSMLASAESMIRTLPTVPARTMSNSWVLFSSWV
ncbi:hypothetical protein D3C85_1607610 [compost metagenome]